MSTPTSAVLSVPDPVQVDAIILDRKLARLQLLTPLSLLIFIAAALISALAASPTLAEISDQYLTILTPSSTLIGAYWGVLVIMLIGQSLLLSIARKPETKQTLVSGVGTRLAAINLLMAAWVLFWTLRLFFIAEMILLGALVLAVSVWGTLLLYPCAASRPFDYVFIHAPMRMLLVILFSCDIWQNGLLALGWYRYIGPLEGQHHGKWEGDHAMHSWIAFGVVMGLAILNSIVVFVWTDFIWATASIYLSIALALNSEGKPPQVFIPLILGAAMVFISLLASVGWRYIRETRDEGEIRLPEDDEVEVATAGAV